MTMTFSDLPEDLLREILCRLPLKDMKAMQLTCKSWDTLSKSDIFRKMHMRNDAAREAGETRVVAIMDYNLHLISLVVADVDHPSTESKGKLSRLSLDDSDKQEIKILKVFHCEGLLLCVLKDTLKLVVWNPYLGQTGWIEPPSYSYRMERYRYAFGYDNNKKSHKILRFVDDYIDSDEPEPRHAVMVNGYSHLCRYEIYDFDSDLWRTLDVGTPHWYIYCFETGVPLKGNTYWLAKHRNSDYDGSNGLVCFDFTSETFGPIHPLPLPSEEGMYRDVIGLLSCLKGEKLSLLLQFEQAQPCVREIWVTDPNNVSWSKLFKVDTGPAADLAFSSSGFFIDEEKKVAMVFDKVPDTRHTLNVIGDPGFFTQVDVDPLIERVVPSGDLVHAHLCSYVPSLVQVQIKKRFSKRKQPSRLELRPCQQNKSRRLDHQEEEEEQVKKRVFKRKLNQVVLDDDWLESSKLELRPCQQNKSRRLDHGEEEQVKKRVFKRKLNQVILDDDWPESSKLELRPCQQNKSRRLDHEEEEEQVILDHD